MSSRNFYMILGVIVFIGLGIFSGGNKPARVAPSVPVAPIATPIAPTPSPTASFEKPITLSSGENVAYSDGLQVALTAIDDSRCKPNVQCIWAGELSAKLAVSGGTISANKEIIIGTVRNQSQDVDGYTFTLHSATVDTAIITVTRSSHGGGPVACSQIAKRCPDGSYVSRTGPNCEFGPCQ